MPPLVEYASLQKACGVAKTKKPEDVAAGQRVKQRRLELGLTQQELAARIGLTSISKHEQGAHSFSAEALTALAKELGVTERWILKGEDEATQVVEDEWEDWPAWTELERSGRIDEFRGKGLMEENIQRIRRWKWRGTPSPRDFERLLEAAVLGPTHEPAPQLQAARARRKAAGKATVPLRARRTR